LKVFSDQFISLALKTAVFMQRNVQFGFRSKYGCADILERWREYCETLYTNTNNDTYDIEPGLAEPVPTVEEVKKALEFTKSGKAAGPDGIPIELLKLREDSVVKSDSRPSPISRGGVGSHHGSQANSKEAEEKRTRNLLFMTLTLSKALCRLIFRLKVVYARLSGNGKLRMFSKHFGEFVNKGKASRSSA